MHGMHGNNQFIKHKSPFPLYSPYPAHVMAPIRGQPILNMPYIMIEKRSQQLTNTKTHICLSLFCNTCRWPINRDCPLGPI